MEPVTTVALALGAWEIIGKPFAEKAREYYSEKVLESLPKLWEKYTYLPDSDKKEIEAVIIEIPEDIRKNEKEFKKYIENKINIVNNNIGGIIVTVDKGTGYIHHVDTINMNYK